MSQQSHGLRRVNPVLKALMPAPLALATGYVFLSLILFGGSTGSFFAWRMSGVSASWADQVRWGSPGAWAVVLVLLSFTGLGSPGVGVSWLLDPPEAPGAPDPAGVRPARTA